MTIMETSIHRMVKSLDHSLSRIERIYLGLSNEVHEFNQTVLLVFLRKELVLILIAVLCCAVGIYRSISAV
jgi:hypothetical protein